MKIKKDGKKNIVKKNEINIPTPAIAPSCAKPVKEVKIKLKKPMAIATAVKNNACWMLLLVSIKRFSFLIALFLLTSNSFAKISKALNP